MTLRIYKSLNTMSQARQILANMKTREVATSHVESAANTFTQKTLDLSSYFSQREFEAGVVLVGIDSFISPPVAASAANTIMQTEVAITTDSQASVKEINTSTVLWWKTLAAASGADASCLNYCKSFEPFGKQVPPERRVKVDKSSPDLYIQIKSAGSSAAYAVYFRLTFLMAPLRSG